MSRFPRRPVAVVAFSASALLGSASASATIIETEVDSVTNGAGSASSLLVRDREPLASPAPREALAVVLPRAADDATTTEPAPDPFIVVDAAQAAYAAVDPPAALVAVSSVPSPSGRAVITREAAQGGYALTVAVVPVAVAYDNQRTLAAAAAAGRSLAAALPEPSSVALLGLGALAVVVARRRRRGHSRARAFERSNGEDRA